MPPAALLQGLQLRRFGGLPTQVGAAGPSLHAARQPLRIATLGGGPGSVEHRPVVELAAPQVSGLLQQRRITLREDLNAPRQIMQRRVIAQHPAAERVDGADTSLVKGMQGQPQQTRRPLHTAGPPPESSTQAHRLLIGLLCGRGVTLLAASQLNGQALAQAQAQFRAGRFAEGHHQDLLHRQLLLQKQTQIDRGQGMSLAGTGGRLHQHRTLKRHFQGVKTPGGRNDNHAQVFSRWASRGSHTARAQLSKSVSRSS